MHCPKCEGKERSKAGFHKKRQRYKCRACGCFYTQSAGRGYPLRLREAAVTLYVFGLSMNAIARLLGVSHQTSYRWIRARAESLPHPTIHHSVTEAEIDEMCLYLKKRAAASGYGKCTAANLKSLSPGMWVLAMREN